MRIIAKKEGKNPAGQRSSMLKVVAQSFAYTSIPAGAGHEGVGEGHKIDKLFLPIKKKKNGDSLISFFTNSRVREKSLLSVACLETLHHSNTEIQSLSAESIKARVFSFERESREKRSSALTHRLPEAAKQIRNRNMYI